MYISRFVCIILVFSLTSLGCNNTNNKKLQEITIQLVWSHQAQFAGLYAADQLKFFEAENIKVNFLEGGPNIRAIDSVLSDKAQFGILPGNQILIQRDKGLPIKAIATIFQISPTVLVSFKELNIKKPGDLKGKTISTGKGGEALIKMIAASAGLKNDQFTIVEASPGLDDLYTGKVDVRAVFLTNQILTMKKDGKEINIIYPDDYQIHFYGDTVFTTDSLILQNPDLIKRFVRAAIKGWNYVIENQNLMAKYVHMYNPNSIDLDEDNIFNASVPLINTGNTKIGSMSEETWLKMSQFMISQDVIKAGFNSKEAFTLDFLKE